MQRYFRFDQKELETFINDFLKIHRVAERATISIEMVDEYDWQYIQSSLHFESGVDPYDILKKIIDEKEIYDEVNQILDMALKNAMSKMGKKIVNLFYEEGGVLVEYTSL